MKKIYPPPLVETENATKSKNYTQRTSRSIAPPGDVCLDEANKPTCSSGPEGNPAGSILLPPIEKHAVTFLIRKDCLQ